MQTVNADAIDRARRIKDRMPPQGLFEGHDWRVAPEPFPLPGKTARDLEDLGRVFLQFYRAVNLLYRRSVEGRQPAWVAQWLDQGKPPELVALQRSAALRNELPRVIRPDLLLTDGGLAVTELDSVPGGIGLTAWLNKAYAELGFEVIGGPEGMLTGFNTIFGDANRVHIVISEEAATYRPEMEWLAGQINSARFSLQNGDFSQPAVGDAVYRFFELFDLPNVPGARALLRLAEQRQIRLTPPPKPIFEEKLLFALLWNRNLRPFWRQELGQRFLERLLALAPYTWVLDPAELPPQAAIPELGLTAWSQLKEFSQRERDLILKISGFSPKAWGARGVFLGSDLSQADWAAAVDEAIAGFGTSPYVLQRYHKPAAIDAVWVDLDANALQPMKGRVRLCPYYFVLGEAESARAVLGGVLATICPANKKIIHGMSEAILAPCAVGTSEP